MAHSCISPQSINWITNNENIQVKGKIEKSQPLKSKTELLISRKGRACLWRSVEKLFWVEGVSFSSEAAFVGSDRTHDRSCPTWGDLCKLRSVRYFFFSQNADLVLPVCWRFWNFLDLFQPALENSQKPVLRRCFYHGCLMNIAGSHLEI